MRLHSKYKGYNQLSQPFDRFPLRILKFKNTKWKKIQKVLSISQLSKKKFVENFSIKVPYKTWEKINNYYKEGHKLKSSIYMLYDKAVSVSYFRSILKNNTLSSTLRNMYLHTLLKPEFRLDILLWRLHFFDSSYQARQAINEKKVKVNQKRVAGNFFLSKGDIISFSESFNFRNLDISQKINKNTQSDTVFSFVEVDYYSNTVVVIKNLKDLTTDDFHLLLNETYNIKKIKDYI